MEKNKKMLKYLVAVLMFLVLALVIGAIVKTSADKDSATTKKKFVKFETENTEQEASEETSESETKNVWEKHTENTLEETVENDGQTEETNQESAIDESSDAVSGQEPETLQETTVEKENPADIKEEGVIYPVDMGEGITLMAVQSYSGKFIEDGSDELVSEVMSLIVQNNGEKDVQLIDFKLVDQEGKTYQFRITTLMPGQTLIALENERASYKENVKIVSAEVEHFAEFSEKPQMAEDVFKIESQQNLIIVTNISDKKILAARVCYKNMIDGVYLGGITYTVSIPELLPGETVELSTKHYTKDTSQMVFVTYAK